MRTDYPSRRSVFGVGELITVGVVGILAASVLGYADASPHEDDSCTLSFRPSQLQAGEQPLDVEAFPSAASEIPEELRVTGPNGSPLRSVVDPRDAEPGELEMTLRQGGSDVCGGQVTVRGHD